MKKIFLTLILTSCAPIGLDVFDLEDRSAKVECISNENCPAGERCVAGACQDIYFPGI